MRILITGVSGTLGSNIFKILNKYSSIEVWGICRDKFSFIQNHNPPYTDKIIELDLSKEYFHNSLPHYFDCLIHAAAITPNSKRNIIDYNENSLIAHNIFLLNTQVLFDRVFVLSSGSVYKNNQLICDELSEIDFENKYGSSMLESERIIRSKLENVIVFRLFYVYGINYKDDTTLINKLRKRIRNKEIIKVSNNYNNSQINPLYFSDLILIMRSFITEKLPFGIYNLAGPHLISFKYFLELLSKIENQKLIVEVDDNIQSPIVASTIKVNKLISVNRFTTFEKSITNL